MIRFFLTASDSALKAYVDLLPPVTEKQMRIAAQNVRDACASTPSVKEAESNLADFRREMSEKDVGPFG